MPSKGDILIDIVTQLGAVSWERFKLIYARVVFGNDWDSKGVDPIAAATMRRDDLRALDMLGFLETNTAYGREPFRITPPTLYTAIPQKGAVTGVLSGARSLVTKAIIENYLEGTDLTIEAPTTTQFHVPSDIRVVAETSEVFEIMAEELQFQYCEIPAASIATRLSSIDEYLATLNWEFSELPSRFVVFSPDSLTFQSPVAKSYLRPGLLRYDDTKSGIPVFIIWNGSKGAVADPDWGRWLILKHQRKFVLDYDARDGSLSYPRLLPLPSAQAKAAALSTGKSPRYVGRANETEFISIEGVPELVVRRIASTLGQELRP